ncbi:MAG: NTF2-like N-terminal transpeptidase domain-containing protein, partial [Anaerolineales bacterium]
MAACSSNSGGVAGIFATPTPLPTPKVDVTPAPDVAAAFNSFFEALQQNDYESMYAMLSGESQSGITLEDFSKRWNNALNEMSAAS